MSLFSTNFRIHQASTGTPPTCILLRNVSRRTLPGKPLSCPGFLTLNRAEPIQRRTEAMRKIAYLTSVALMCTGVAFAQSTTTPDQSSTPSTTQQPSSTQTSPNPSTSPSSSPTNSTTDQQTPNATTTPSQDQTTPSTTTSPSSSTSSDTTSQQPSSTQPSTDTSQQPSSSPSSTTSPSSTPSSDQGNMVVINQISPIYADFSLPEKYLADVKKYLSSGTLKVIATLPDSSSPLAQGKVAFIDNAVDRATGTINMRRFSSAVSLDSSPDGSAR